MEIVENLCVYCGVNECFCWTNEAQNEVKTQNGNVQLGAKLRDRFAFYDMI